MNEKLTIDLAEGEQPITIIKDGYKVEAFIKIDYINLNQEGQIQNSKVKIYTKN